MFGRSKSKQEPANPVRVVKDATGAAAVDLDAVKAAGHVDLAKGAATVGVSLRKRWLAFARWYWRTRNCRHPSVRSIHGDERNYGYLWRCLVCDAPTNTHTQESR